MARNILWLTVYMVTEWLAYRKHRALVRRMELSFKLHTYGDFGLLEVLLFVSEKGVHISHDPKIEPHS